MSEQTDVEHLKQKTMALMDEIPSNLVSLVYWFARGMVDASIIKDLEGLELEAAKAGIQRAQSLSEPDNPSDLKENEV